MKLTNSFQIDRPPEEVFDAFLDIERIATCMPGSKLLGSPAEDTYDGEVKVKVGPLSVTYTGQLNLLSADRGALKLTMRAKGREQRGAGNADAHVVAQLSADNGGTVVEIVTDLSIRGKVAQFGRGVIGEVTDGIIQKFAANVEEMLKTGGQSTAPQGTTSTRPPTPQSAPASESTGLRADPIETTGDDNLDAMQLIVVPMIKRYAGTLAPIAAAGLAAYIGARIGARRSRRRPAHHYYD